MGREASLKVTPIIAPTLNWPDFVTEVHRALGRSPTASIHMAGLKPGLLKSTIPALGEFQHEHTAAIPFMKSRDCDQVLSHLHCSFLVEAPRETVSRLVCLANLSLLAPDDSETVVILTGSLQAWRSTVLSLSRKSVATDVRQAINEIHKCLVVAGLGDLFAGVTTKRQSDGTIVLEV